MRTCVVVNCLALALAHNATANGDCDGAACRDRCNKQYSGHPATCYCAKGCASMDCSHDYHVNDDNHFCNMKPENRHSECMKTCKNAASGHDDWVNDCKFGCGYWCDVTTTKGHWVWLQDISLPEKYTFRHGTKKTHSESQTKEWSVSVTRTVSRGFKFGGASLSETVGQRFAESTSDEWEQWTDEKFTWKATEAEVGKSVWMFQLTHTDVCGHTETTRTKNLAVTSNGDDPPCCVPGHASDAPKYQQCTGGTPNACKGELTV